MKARIWIVHFLLGLSSGIPLLLTGSTLQVWMTEFHVDLKTIGAFALVGLPYNLKFLWAPLIDRYSLPFLSRRRGWMLLSQLLLAASILALGGSDPLASIGMTAFLAILLAFMSATQDLVIDAYRRESLTEKQMGFGLTLYSTGYRIGMILASAVSFHIMTSFHLSWFEIYALMAGAIGIGMIATFLAPETSEMGERPPGTLKEATFGPFKDFFSQKGIFYSFAFLILYKLGDNLSSSMTAPFVIQHGYTKVEYGDLVKFVGIGSTIVGGFFGSWVIMRAGLNRALWIFGFLQAAAILSLVWLANIPKNNVALAIAISAEMLTAGMAVPAFNTFIAFLTNKKFTATQYALLTSLGVLPRTLLSAPSGWIALQLGWSSYFIFCATIAIPGLLLLTRIAPWNQRHASEH